MTEFTIEYNFGKGKMTLNLEVFFERKKNGKFIHTTKPDIYEVFKLVYEWCEEEQIEFLLEWLKSHDCADIAEYYEKKYGKHE